MNAVVGELVDISRRGSLVAGAELPLVDLATQLAQRWADRLAERDRSLSASAEGDLATAVAAAVRAARVLALLDDPAAEIDHLV